MDRKKSSALFEEAKNYFPGGVNSPVRAFKSVEGPPVFVERGEGAKIYDEDGYEYIDFCCSWGPLILGHNNTQIREAVTETIQKGMSFGTPTKLGNQIGKLILENNRFIDKMRFVSSGTEAVMSAIRLARGYTGKKKIIKFEGCYHGHVDSLMVKAGSGLATFGVSTSAGIPEEFAKETVVVPLNDIDALDKALDLNKGDVACVIIEPIPANNGLLLQDKTFLEYLRSKTKECGVLLIFDEVISGFRVGFEGAAGYYDIQPDIITYGKIIGGGMPVGAFGSTHEIMGHVAPEGPVYQAGTLSANPVAMTAGFAACEQLLAPDFYEELAKKTKHFVSAIEEFITKKSYPLSVVNIGSIFWFAFGKERITRSDQIDAGSMEHFKKLHAYLLHNGVYLGPSGYEVGFVSSAHSYEVLEIAATKICDGLDTVFG